MDIQRYPDEPDKWQVHANGNEYLVTLRRSQYGPNWTASVLVIPRGDQKPYWRTLRNWQKLAGAVREFENRSRS